MNAFKPKMTRGYSLPAVLLMSALLASALGILTTTLISNAKVSGKMIAGRRAFYACDGLNRTLTRLSQNYMATTTQPNSTDLKDFVCTEGGGCPGSGAQLPLLAPDGFTITEVNINSIGNRNDEAVIPSGPFKGMNSQQDNVTISTRAEKTGEGFRCRSEAEVTLARIAMFQFFLFGDTYLDWQPGPVSEVRGRSHVNYDTCLGAGSGLSLQNITSAGRILHFSNASECEVHRSATNAVKVAAKGDTNMTSFAELDSDAQHGCTNCANSGLAWKEYAIDKWGSNLQDVAHDVPALRVPISGDPQTQSGARADGTTEPNNTNSRFLVDPVLATDGPDIREQKYAAKADIRILDGVWYIPDVDNPDAWPGLPIWSDHPGHFTTPNNFGEGNIDAGQDDIRALWDSKGYPWPTSPVRTPRDFSYYEYDKAASTISNDDRGVISYGTLNRETSGGVSKWHPGGVVENNNSVGANGVPRDTALCRGLTGASIPNTYPVLADFATTTDALRGNYGFRAVGSSLSLAGGTSMSGTDTLSSASVKYSVKDDAASSIRCGSSVIPVASRILQATRSGFRDPHVEMAGYGGISSVTKEEQQRSARFSANFDIEAFISAMNNTEEGEPGSYFCGAGSCYSNRPFNGVVYVSMGWPGSNQGYDDAGGSNQALPMEAPPQMVSLDNATFADFDSPSLLNSGLSNRVTFDPLQPPTSSLEHVSDGRTMISQVSALPYALCTDDMSGDGVYNLNDDASRLDPLSGFRAADCNRYTTLLAAEMSGTPTPGALARFPDSIRFINGHDILESTLRDGTVIANASDWDIDGRVDGLSVVTNLPFFVVGAMNTTSQTPNTNMSDATPWAPLMLGGDRMRTPMTIGNFPQAGEPPQFKRRVQQWIRPIIWQSWLDGPPVKMACRRASSKTILSTSKNGATSKIAFEAPSSWVSIRPTPPTPEWAATPINRLSVTGVLMSTLKR